MNINIMNTGSTKTKNSAEKVAANQDLLMEILLRLPIKSLYRLKSVSIGWRNLISTPYFSQRHSHRNATAATTGLFLHHHPSLMHLSLSSGDGDSLPSFGPVSMFDFLRITPDASNLTILGSCGGLMLCLLVEPPWSDADVVYLVSNPTTKFCNHLPPLDDLANRPIVNMDLAFDPRHSPHYRVICMRNCNPPDGPEFQIQIFSSETGAWLGCDGAFYNIPTGMQFHGGVYWNKSIHYLNQWGGNSIYFEIDGESLKLLPMPAIEGGAMAKRSWYLGESGGHLHLVEMQSRDVWIKIYEMRSDYSGWMFQHRVDLSAMEGERVETAPFAVVCVVEGEGGLEIVLWVPNRLVSYNVRNNKSKVLVYFGDDRDGIGYEWNNVVRYTPTLATPDLLYHFRASSSVPRV